MQLGIFIDRLVDHGHEAALGQARQVLLQIGRRLLRAHDRSYLYDIVRPGFCNARRAITMTRCARYSGVAFASLSMRKGSRVRPSSASGLKSLLSAASSSRARNTPLAPAPVTATRTPSLVRATNTPTTGKREAALRNLA